MVSSREFFDGLARSLHGKAAYFGSGGSIRRMHAGVRTTYPLITKPFSNNDKTYPEHIKLRPTEKLRGVLAIARLVWL